MAAGSGKVSKVILYKNAEEMKVRLEERVYKLERDDEAFLQSIR